MPTKLIRKQFLLSQEENEQLEKEAKSEGLSVSNLTRIRHGLQPLEAGGKRERIKSAIHKNRDRSNK